jgi:sugar phosphate isomerase/epimerase
MGVRARGGRGSDTVASVGRVSTTRIRADQVGVCVSTLHVTPHQFDTADIERCVAAAAGAGFPSLVFQVHWADTYGGDALRALLDDQGMTAGGLEGSMSWVDGPEAASRDADRLLDLASAIGADMLHAASLAPDLDLPRAADGFAALCERAEEHDIDVALEFIPYYGVPDLKTAWDVVRESRADNGGICLDFMHFQRQPGGPDYDLLRQIPAEHLTYVQPTDAPAEVVESPEGYMTQCITERPVPGDGVIDIDRMVEAIEATGADPYLAFQVCNPALAGAGADVMASKLRASAARMFD